MTDTLTRFRSEQERADEADETGVQRTLLMFEYADQLIGVPAESVDAVIAWMDPSPLPMARGLFAGVVQDRGRIVTVLRAPVPSLGGKEASARKRIIVCKTPQGFIGLPATRTHGVNDVRLASAPSPGEVVDSSEGPVTIVFPGRILHEQAAPDPTATGRTEP